MIRKIAKILAICICAIILFSVLITLVGISVFKNSNDFVKLDTDKLNEVSSNLKITDEQGNALKDTFYFGKNKQIPLSSLHNYTYLAFVAVEDKRFFEHDGLDARRIVGAAVRNAKSRSFKEGASTITQQLIKNTHLSRDKNVKRKANEMLLALELENRYSKKEILEMYLNTIYFGRNAYGIENAANAYFNKSAECLTVAESATLAAMIKAPNVYAPDKNAEKSLQRRNTVLKLMREQQMISEECYNDALSEQLHYHPYVNSFVKTYARMVIDEACEILNVTQSQLLHSGYVIETYFDEDVQTNLNECVALDETKNVDGTTPELSCIICNNFGGVAACYFRGECATSPKQIGSTAKPFAVYTPAFCEKIITQASPILDEETDFSGYKPSTNGKYSGWTTVKDAVTRSMNVPAVKTLNSLGLKTAQKYLVKMGINGEQNLSLALGNVEGGLTPQQLVNCYLVLANGGERNDCNFIKSIKKDNNVIYKRENSKTRVFDEKSTYLTTDLLKNVVQSGTAKRLKSSFQIAAKTGTVGNRNGNSQALVAGYTTSHTFVFWFSGNLPNSVNGGSSPCTLATKVLNQMYESNSPADFSPPKGIEKLFVDSHELRQNQLVVCSDHGEQFLFDCENTPKTVNRHKFDFKITVINDGTSVKLSLPQVPNGMWRVFRKGENQEFKTNEIVTKSGFYYAKLLFNNACAYTTPQIYVNIGE